jgi:hypothetical protein
MSEFEIGILRNPTREEREDFQNIFDKSDPNDDIHAGLTLSNEKNRELIKKCKTIKELQDLKLFCHRCYKISKKLDSEKFNSDPKKCWADFQNLKFTETKKSTEKTIVNGMKTTIASEVSFWFQCPLCKGKHIFSFEAQEIPDLLKQI